jgi:Abnormal spindle-like microcephaly-assoc'd, ASPM-SPD-2-Hydin
MDLLASDQNGVLWLFVQGSFPAGSISPGSLNFGNQTVGTTSAPQAVTLTNTGLETLTLSAVTVSGTDASEFMQTNTCTATLVVGASCKITVTFAPAASGTRSATLNIPHNGIGSQTVPLTGVGDTTPPTVKLPADLTFPARGIGTKSSGKVVLNNPGPGTVTAPVITLTGADAGDFSEVNTCQSELLTGASCQVTVTFSPPTIGSRSASLNFSDNASGSPQSVPLKGSGPDFNVSLPSPTSLTIAAGQTARYSLDVQPLGGFNQTVTLTCGGAPAGATCMLPASISLSTEVGFYVSVATTARPVAMNRSSFSRGGRWLACGLFALPLIVSLAGVAVRRPRARVHRRVWLVLILAATSLVPACGSGTSGGGAGTPAGTYLLTVAGKYTTGGTTLSHTTTLTLIVQ